jgi:hypothetical protein
MLFHISPSALLCSDSSFRAVLESKLGAFPFVLLIRFTYSSYHTWPRPPFTVGMMCYGARIDVDMETSYFNQSTSFSPDRHGDADLLVLLALKYQCRHRSSLCAYINPHDAAKTASNSSTYVAIRLVWL